MRLGMTGWVVAVAAFGWASQASADERKFNYSYEAKTLPQGTWEFEQWATLKMEKDAGDYNRLDLREEFEYGVTDKLTMAVYLNSEYLAVRNVPGESNDHHFLFTSVSNEWKYKISDPSTDLVGFLIYGEILLSHEEYDLEAKLVFSKHLGPLTFAYNFVYEAELARDALASPEWRWAHIIENSAGVSLDLPMSGFSAAVEARSEMHFERSLTGAHNSAYYAGPNVHYAASTWWATLSFLRQLNIHGLDFSEDAYTKYEVRLVFGVNF
jgi:hypothetical protein